MKPLFSWSLMAGLLACPSILLAQLPAVSRWMDPQGQARPLHAPADTTQPLVMSGAWPRSVSHAPDTNRVCVVVHSSVMSDVGPAINQFMTDLSREGYSPLLYVYSSGSAEALREHLASLYTAPGSLTGAILVGALPHVIFEMMQNWGGDGPDEYEDFPCDLFYMDLDGSWLDQTNEPPFAAGKYDSRAGNPDLEIWVSRLKADLMPALGAETVLLNRYFGKDHRYRTGAWRPYRRVLLYNDDDWTNHMKEDVKTVSMPYGDDHTRVVMDPENTTAEDYKKQMTNHYEMMFVRSHGYSGGHGFYQDNRQVFHNIYLSDYQERLPEALFYSLYICSGCDYMATNYLGGVIVLNDRDSGLVAWGSAKTGGMFAESHFFEPLAQRQSVGEAFVHWFNHMQALYPSYAPAWCYGMVLAGDASLRLWGREPAVSGLSWHADLLDIRFHALQGEWYQMRRTESLTEPSWMPFGPAWQASDYAESFMAAGDPGVAGEFYGVAWLESEPSNLLRNASFEVSGSSDRHARHWDESFPGEYGGSWGSAARVDWRSRQGAVEAALLGYQHGDDFGGWWQEVPAQQGLAYEASAWFWADRSSIVWTAVSQELKIEFYDSEHGLLDSVVEDLSGVGENWTQHFAAATAPAGTAWARFVVEVTGAGPEGALQFDQAVLGIRALRQDHTATSRRNSSF